MRRSTCWSGTPKSRRTQRQKPVSCPLADIDDTDGKVLHALIDVALCRDPTSLQFQLVVQLPNESLRRWDHRRKTIPSEPLDPLLQLIDAPLVGLLGALFLYRAPLLVFCGELSECYLMAF